jgi:pimeloyl-ACP methyl ester carboxylesterase
LELLPALVSPGHRSPGLDETVLTMADEVGETLLDAQLAIQETRQDERPALPRVRVPTLVLAGGEDGLVPVERHEEVRAGVPAAQLQVLDGVGHLSTLEAPDAVAAALSAWLTR